MNNDKVIESGKTLFLEMISSGMFEQEEVVKSMSIIGERVRETQSAMLDIKWMIEDMQTRTKIIRSSEYTDGYIDGLKEALKRLEKRKNRG